VKYLLPVVRLGWWWGRGDSWLRTIIWIVIVISWRIGALSITFILVSICGT
jgi:hypothetical protein